MKSALLVVKAFALLAIAAAALVGFGFFRVWQANEAPRVTTISWRENSVGLGRATLLHMEVSSPWHRSISSPRPLHLPESLVAATSTPPSLVRGSLDWSGHRHWRLSIPLVATAPGALEGASIELPLASTRRKSPRTVSASLPRMMVELPTELPDSPLNPLELLSDTTPPPPPPAALAEQAPRHYGAIAIAVFVLATALAVLLRWLRRPGPVIPAWDLANASLDQLQRETALNPERFFSRLTDILKRYTAARFHDNATAASSTEFIASLRSLHDLDSAHPARLSTLVRQADAVKFAGARPTGDAPTRALDAVRSFVKDTTPTPDPEPEHA